MEQQEAGSKSLSFVEVAGLRGLGSKSSPKVQVARDNSGQEALSINSTQAQTLRSAQNDRDQSSVFLEVLTKTSHL